jgi:hypothetical protein
MKKLLLLLPGIIFLGACASSPEPSNHSTSSATAKADRGVIYFYRDLKSETPATRQVVFTVKEDGNDIGTLEGGTYFYHYVKPGRQYFSVVRSYPSWPSDKGSGQFINVQPGKRYYVQAVPRLRQGQITTQVFVTFPDQGAPTINDLAQANETY